MTTSTRETTLRTHDDVPLIRIVREFDASPDKVFRAHAEADLFARWMGPRDTEMVVDHYDCRTGGSYRYSSSSGGFDATCRGCFHEVRPAELIVQTFGFDGMPDTVLLERLVFEEIGDGRTRLTVTSLFDSFADRDAFVATGLEAGVRETYERLDEVLTGQV